MKMRRRIMKGNGIMKRQKTENEEWERSEEEIDNWEGARNKEIERI